LLVGSVHADQFDQQINQLKDQNNSLRVQDQVLASEAIGFQATIDNLAAQINSLETQIRANQARQVELQLEIERQKVILGQNIKAMYLEGEISTFEVLASSNDLSTFVDKEQYRNTVKDKVTTALDTINRLKREVEKIIADQKTIQSQLDVQRAEQARLLALNQSQRDALDAQMRNNSAQINDLRKQQATLNARLFGNGIRHVADPSGYPYANVGFPNSISDPWGMYKRQCVSYTAWKVANSGRHMPFWGGHGNANQWDENARAEGIPVDSSPRVGDVAVSNAGTYGHVMYVEAVYDDGTIYVSQYNANWTGRYSEAKISVGSLVFIHFQ
jgi:surface antigen